MRLGKILWTGINLLISGGGGILESNSIQRPLVSPDQSGGYFCPDLTYSSSVTFGDPQWPGSFYNFYYTEPAPKFCSDPDYMLENLEKPINAIAEGIANGTLCGGIPALGLADKPFWGGCSVYDRDGMPCNGYFAAVFAAGGNSSISSNFTVCAITLVQPHTQAVNYKINICIRNWAIGSGSVIGVALIIGVSWFIYKCCPPKICQKESKSGCCSRFFSKKDRATQTPLLNVHSAVLN